MMQGAREDFGTELGVATRVPEGKGGARRESRGEGRREGGGETMGRREEEPRAIRLSPRAPTPAPRRPRPTPSPDARRTGGDRLPPHARPLGGEEEGGGRRRRRRREEEENGVQDSISYPNMVRKTSDSDPEPPPPFTLM